jgi:hypothetical protein
MSATLIIVSLGTYLLVSRFSSQANALAAAISLISIVVMAT